MLSLELVTSATGGRCDYTGQLEFTGVTTDSRAVQPGDLFVALSGERFDGHAYAKSACLLGATGVLVSRDVTVPDGVAVIRVADTLKAYQDIAHAYRMSLPNLKVVAITGSNGKTSTKDMVAAVLAKKYRVVKTQANFNNEIGLPKTLLSVRPDTEIAVVEMGMRGLGQIKAMCAIARPDYAVITNVGETHIGELGSMENIARAKSEILEDLPQDGFSVLNGDLPLVREMATKLRAPVAWFGLRAEDDWRAEQVQVTSSGTTYTAVCGETGARVNVVLKQIGEHNVYNSLAALAIGGHLGVQLTDSVAALANYEATGKRQEMLHFGTVTVINDAYNASPASMEAALKTLHELKKDGAAGCRSIAVLADMLELGAGSADAHRRVGALAVQEQTDWVLTYGAEAAHISEEIVRQGGATQTQHCEDRAAAAAQLKRLLRDGDVVLLKGSHSMAVDGIIGLVFQQS